MTADGKVGRVALRPETRELVVDGKPTPVGARAYDLMARLMAEPDKVVSKAALMDAAWPGLAVVENNLNAQVKALRQVLGDQAILTVPGRGYRLGRLRPDSEPMERERDKAAIAILPFDNLSGDPEQAYFADGVAEEIMTALTAFKQLLVIARNASFSVREQPVDAREVGRRLGARYLLQGSVRRADARVRISAQLIETGRGAQIWAERYDSPLADVFDLQDSIAASVVAAIEPAIQREEIELARRKRPQSLAAYDLFLRALPHLWAMTPADNADALRLLERALELEPQFASALAYAAWALEQRLSRSWPSAREPQRAEAVGFARKALALAPDDATVVAVSGFVILVVGRDPEGGLTILRRAASLNPRSAFVLTLAGTGHLFAGDLGVARAQLEMAARLSPADPTGFLIQTALACAGLLSGEPEAAAVQCAHSAALNPNWDFTWWVAAAAAGETGDRAKAREAFANLARLNAGAPVAFPAFRVFSGPSRRENLLRALAKTGLWAVARS